MSLQSPNLDDRAFADLMAESIERIKGSCPGWTDLSAGDPGIVLLELFAHLTEVMIYRLNRVPEKAYIEFLRLLGVTLEPPAAAACELGFTRSKPGTTPLLIPRGTRITIKRSGSGGEGPVFTTDTDARIEPGETSTTVLAHHCELVDAELLGVSSGAPGQSFELKRPPVIAPTGDGLDLIIGVEAERSELDQRADARRFGEKAFRVWLEVEDFTSKHLGPYVYVADRAGGRITFAPSVQLSSEGGGLASAASVLGAVPPAGREILAWYRRGGGAEGNVAANLISVLKDPIASLAVTNTRPATGGRAAETLRNALVRGPHEFRSLQRVITADDFERASVHGSGGVARAKAAARADRWVHARRGTVDVSLVPALPTDVLATGRIGIGELAEHQTDLTRKQVEDVLNTRKPLGTIVSVKPTKYKEISVKVRIVTHPEENPEVVRARVEDGLYRTLCPLPTRNSAGKEYSGWRFGAPVRVSTVYDIALSEPGVSFVDTISLTVDGAPSENVRCIAADVHQPAAWYAGAGSLLYRTVNNAEGWEPVGRFDPERVDVVVSHPDRPGFIAVATTTGSADDNASAIYVSEDCGESWVRAAALTFRVNDLAWTVREQTPLLLMATDKGLYELLIAPGTSPIAVLVDPADQDLGMSAVVVATISYTNVQVAVAAQQTKGVYLSLDAGRTNTFKPIELRGSVIQTMQVERAGPRTFLWAGVAVNKVGDEGKGCFRCELSPEGKAPREWEAVNKGWRGGSCYSIAFGGDVAFASTHRAGVLRIKAAAKDGEWEPNPIDCGLPIRDEERLLFPVEAVACTPSGTLALAGGPRGVYRSVDSGVTYANCSNREELDRITLPDNWLVCSGRHQVEVISEDAARARESTGTPERKA